METRKERAERLSAIERARATFEGAFKAFMQASKSGKGASADEIRRAKESIDEYLRLMKTRSVRERTVVVARRRTSTRQRQSSGGRS